MSKVAHYLQEHVVGEVMTSLDVRRHFATDASIFTLAPSVIVYPRNESDIRKTARFCWQLAERGRVIPITARGSGTDQSGAAIGSGVILSFPAHLNHIIEFDNKTGLVTVEPGINYGKLQQTLETHGRFLPPFPASIEYSTVGGAVANNASGEKSIKYGDTRAYVKSLKVVLANGEIIETRRLNKRELSKKLGLSTFEGEIYRAIDTLIEENQATIDKTELGLTKNNAGYSLLDVKNKEGFDLTPLLVGSQGTLGIITEISLETELYNPHNVLLTGFFDSIKHAESAILELRKLSSLPSAIEMVNDNVLKTVQRINPNLLKDVLPEELPKISLIVEFDDPSERNQKRLVKKAHKILDKFAVSTTQADTADDRDKLWKIRHAVAIVLAQSDSMAKSIPIIDDGIVPPDKYAEFLTALEELLQKNHVQAASWGHAGDGNIHTHPLLDLAQVGDRQKVIRLMEEYYDLVISLGGSISGEHNDGRLRAPYLSKLYNADICTMFEKVKQIFDPYNILNPGIKTNVTLEDIKPLIRQEYSLHTWYDKMPRS